MCFDQSGGGRGGGGGWVGCGLLGSTRSVSRGLSVGFRVGSVKGVGEGGGFMSGRKPMKAVTFLWTLHSDRARPQSHVKPPQSDAEHPAEDPAMRVRLFHRRRVALGV